MCHISEFSKKVTLISFSVESVLRFQCVFILFLADAQLTKIPTPTQGKEFCHMAMRRICKLERRPERPMAAYSVFVVAYWQFLLQSRLSDSIEQYNEPPRLHRNFAKSHFVVQIYQTDARCGGSRNAIEEMTGEKRCLTVKISYPS